MFSMFNILFCIGAVIFCVKASTEDLKQIYTNMLKECVQEYQLTENDYEQLKNKRMPESEAGKCMIACAYKKTGMMDDKGMLSIDGTNQIVEKYFANDPESLKKGVALTETCKSVNDIAVSDGDKGCERASLIFKCTVDNLPGQFHYGNDLEKENVPSYDL